MALSTACSMRWPSLFARISQINVINNNRLKYPLSKNACVVYTTAQVPHILVKYVGKIKNLIGLL